MSRRAWAMLAVLLAGVVVLLPSVALAQDGAAPEPMYQTLDELAGKQFAYVNGSVYNQFVHQKIGETKEDDFYASLSDCVAAVEAGKADAAVQLSYCCEAVVNRKGGTVALLPETVGEVEEAFFFPHGDPLVAKFDAVIDKFEKDGTIERLTKKWVAADESGKTLPAQDWDAPNGTLKFATSGVLDPFSYVGEGGEIKGYDVELALLIAKELGYHLEVSTITMDAIFASVQTGKVDFGGTLTNTPERAETVDFSERVMPTYISVIVKAKGSASNSASEELEISSLSELPGKRLGVVNGSTYPLLVSKALEGVSEKDFQYYDSSADTAAALKAGKIDAEIEGMATGEVVIANHPELGMLKEPIVSDNIGLCLKKGSPLTPEFNKLIAKYKQDGTLEALHKKWMAGSDVKKELPAQDWDAPNGTLNVMGSVLEPMCYVGDGGQVMGYEVELMLNIARDLGYRVEFTTSPFTGLLGAVESGKADVALGNISITDERKEQVDLTDPDYEGGIVVIARKKERSAVTGFVEGIADSFRKTFIEEDRWHLIIDGLEVTLVIAVCAGVLGVLLGFGTVLARRSGVRWVAKLVSGYQALMGGIPIVVVLMVLYYVVFGSISIAGEIVAILAFTLSFGATAGTTMWTAVEAIDSGQEESGLALGYTRQQVFKKIIFPQALQQFLPQLIGQSVSLLKETAVVGYIAVQDLTRAGDLIRARTMDAFFPLISTAIIYFLCCRLLAWGLGKLTNRLLVANRPRKIEGVVE